MPAPVLQTQGTVAAVTTGNLAITLPAYQADDIVVITTVGWVPNTTTGTNTQSLGSPWTKYSPNVTTITSSLIDAEYACWWARATSNDSLGASVTITRPTSWDTGTDTCWGGRAYVIRGCVTSGDPYDQFTASSITTTANPDLPAVTVSAGNRLVVAFMEKADNTTLPTAVSGYTVGTAATDTAGTDCGFQSYRQTASSNVAAVTPTGGIAPGQGGQVYFAFSFDPPIFARTASSSGTGGSSASGARVPTVFQRTATAAGTGSSSAIRVKAKLRTATATGTGSSSATGIYKRVRTATGTGTGGSTSDGQALHQRTATGSGTGSQTAIRLIIRFRTATGTGVGGGEADKDLLHIRTASASGAGSSSATGVRIPGGGAQTFTRTATGTGVGGGSADVDLVHLRTATGTGAGTSTVVSRFFTPRTATGSGLGSSTVVGVRVKVRTATASGTGGSSVTFIRVPRRTATAAGTGGSSVTELLTAKRTATAAGAGSSSVVEILTAKRTATATGAGTSTSTGCKAFRKTATAAGISSSTALSVKLLIFRTPNRTEVRAAERLDDSFATQLFRYVEPTFRGVNVYKLVDGTFTEIEQRDNTLVAKTYWGGSANFVTQAEKDDLIAAGYGSYVT